MSSSALRRTSAVLALAIVVAAGVWVSAVRFKDRASAYDCGVPLGAAQHGYQVPALFVHVPSGPLAGPQSGVLAFPKGGPTFVTVCRGEARTRVAIAAGAIFVAIAGLALSRRRWGRSSPSPAVA